MAVARLRQMVVYHAVFPQKMILATGVGAETLDLPQIRFLYGIAYEEQVRYFDEGSVVAENDRVVFLVARRLDAMIYGTSAPAWLAPQCQSTYAVCIRCIRILHTGTERQG